MDNSYRAIEAVSPGRLQLTRKPLRNPDADQVRIRIEACGVCHSDVATIEGQFPVDWPRVPATRSSGGSTHWVPACVVGRSVSAWVWGFSAASAAIARSAAPESS